jgi:adenine/guanine phosphoribosyltransferase-like PRPP-binding protein
MQRHVVAQKLIERLNETIRRQLNLGKTLILGVVLKGLPVAYLLAMTNDVIENFVPIVAQRNIFMQHQVETYFPSEEWKNYYSARIAKCENLLVVDDVVNTGFTKQRVEGIINSLNSHRHRFGALVLNRRNLANPNFVSQKDFFAVEVNAGEVECDWGLITVPLWDQPVEEGRKRCEDYLEKYWLHEKRMVTIIY